MKRFSRVLSTSPQNPQTLRVIGLRMIPSLNPEYLNGPGTAIFPGFNISTFHSRGTDVGVLGFVPYHTQVYLSNAFTNSTGWNRSSSESPANEEIEAAWQPQVPAFVAYVLYGKTLPKLQEKFFPHNEILLSTDKPNFGGLVITDRGLVDDVDFKAFHREIKEKFGSDDLLFYDQCNFSKVSSSGKIDNVPIKFPEDVICSAMQGSSMSDALYKMYDEYIKDLALSFYNPLLQRDRIEELRVVRRYSKDSPLFDTLCRDIQLALETLQKSNEAQYPQIDFNKKLEAEETKIKLPENSAIKLSENPATTLKKHEFDHGSGRDWTNSGGD